MDRVWELRKAGLGLLKGLGKDARSPSFVEDTAVRVEDLPSYVADFQALMDGAKKPIVCGWPLSNSRNCSSADTPVRTTVNSLPATGMPTGGSMSDDSRPADDVRPDLNDADAALAAAVVDDEHAPFDLDGLAAEVGATTTLLEAVSRAGLLLPHHVDADGAARSRSFGQSRSSSLVWW
jgi:FAD/FMN-containing dehydrogenase